MTGTTGRPLAPRPRPRPRRPCCPSAPDASAPGPATRIITLLLSADDTTPGRARATVRVALDQWELRHLGDNAQAIVSELVANAGAASTRGAPEGAEPAPTTLSITAERGELIIRCWDPDPTPPPPDHVAGPWDEHGRGLMIVRALSHRWGWARPPTAASTSTPPSSSMHPHPDSPASPGQPRSKEEAKWKKPRPCSLTPCSSSSA